MRTSIIPWTDVVLAQARPYYRAAWFVFGCIEREHRLNLDALSAYWLRASMTWLNPLCVHSSGVRENPTAWTQTAAPFSAAATAAPNGRATA